MALGKVTVVQHGLQKYPMTTLLVQYLNFMACN